MNPMVVEAAQQDPVVEVGVFDAGPPDDVMSLRMRRWGGTPAERAAAIPFPERELLHGGEQAPGLAEIEHADGPSNTAGMMPASPAIRRAVAAEMVSLTPRRCDSWPGRSLGRWVSETIADVAHNRKMIPSLSRSKTQQWQ